MRGGRLEIFFCEHVVFAGYYSECLFTDKCKAIVLPKIMGMSFMLSVIFTGVHGCRDESVSFLRPTV